MYFRYRDTRGFTLIEMAIILMILGILVTMGAGMMGALTKRLKLNETREAVKNASESIAGYGATTGSIPASTRFTSVVTVAADSWSNPLYYIPATSLTTDGICARKTTALSLSLCPDKSCSTPSQSITDVAYAIISKGENFNRQTDLKAGVIKVYDVGIGAVDDYSADMNRAEPYDDVVRWATLYELRVKAGCSGPQMRIINKDLPSALNLDNYSAEVFAEGGVLFPAGGKYRWCVETKGQGTQQLQPKQPEPKLVGKQPKQPKQPKKTKQPKKPKQPKQSKAWLKTRPTTIPMDKNCMALAESKWGRSDTLILEGSAQTGTTGITVFVRDDNDKTGPNDNIVSRAFVVTVGK